MSNFLTNLSPYGPPTTRRKFPTDPYSPSGDPNAPVNADWSGAAASPGGGSPYLPSPVLPESQPIRPSDPYSGQMQQVGQQLEQALQPATGVRANIGRAIGIFAPRTGGLISGDTQRMQRANALEQQYGMLGNMAQQERAAELAPMTMEHLGAQTEEQKALTALHNTQAGEVGKLKPSEEEWNVVPGFQGPNGEMIQQEKHSGQMKLADIHGAKPKTAPKDKTLDQQYDDAVTSGDTTRASQILQEKKQLKIVDQASEPGNYVPWTDSQGNTIGWADPKSRNFVPASSISGAPGASMPPKPNPQANQKEIQSYRDLIDNRDTSRTYIKGGKYDGAGDYQTLMAFVNATKPSSGFRFTNTELQTILSAASLGQRAEALYNKAAGGAFLPPDLRQQMLRVLESSGARAEKRIADLQGGAPSKGTTSASGIKITRDANGRITGVE